MKIISWNVNSFVARRALIQKLINNEDPDILLLQEIKYTDTDIRKYFVDFIQDELLFDQYYFAIHGQRQYHGVGILSKFPLEDVYKHECTVTNECRYIEATTNSYRVASIYVPNGCRSEQLYEKKKQFFLSIQMHLQKKQYANLLIGGDYNVALSDDDVESPELWIDHPL